MFRLNPVASTAGRRVNRPISSQMFSDPLHESVVMAAWERFLAGGDSSEALRDAVDGSWQRCQLGQVDPAQSSGPPPISESSLYLLHQAHGELLDLSSPVMAHARDFLSETGTMMALADPRGTILSIEGDRHTIDDGQSIHLMPGGAWSELVIGTNAIGTALALGQPVQIHSAEHYCEGIKRWTCSATVIRHPLDDEILGVVDVSGLSQTFSRHTLGLVVTTASRIENRLAAREMELRYRLLEATMARLSASGHDGMILFDRRGHPIKANGVAQSTLMQRGGPFDLSRPRRLQALALAPQSPHAPVGLPEWIRPDWLHPVTDGGERIGTLLVLPGVQRASRPQVAADDDAAPAARGDAVAFAHLAGTSPALRDVVGKATQLARSKVAVLLMGETGVGKEEFAQGIHRASDRRDGPFIAVNCGGLSRDLLASELFGYTEGAFTGARRGGHAGKIEAANGGTLFLDEIGEMSPDLQPHLLRVLEQGEIQRLGENRARKIDFRLVTATHRDLRREVAAGNFRMDLFYRIAVTSIQVPALRERPSDIRELVAHFLSHFAAEHGLPPHVIDEPAMACLEAYAWPGNVRELRNVIESMLLMADAPSIGVRALPVEIREGIGFEVPPSTCALPRSGLRIDHAERDVIVDTLRTARGNLTRAANLLGIAKSTLYAKLEKYRLHEEVSSARSQEDFAPSSSPHLK